MIKALSVCFAVVMLSYIAFVGHFYYKTFSSFTQIEHAQQGTTPGSEP